MSQPEKLLFSLRHLQTLEFVGTDPGRAAGNERTSIIFRGCWNNTRVIKTSSQGPVGCWKLKESCFHECLKYKLSGLAVIGSVFLQVLSVAKKEPNIEMDPLSGLCFATEEIPDVF